jgi:hypothetical protein
VARYWGLGGDGREELWRDLHKARALSARLGIQMTFVDLGG